LIIYLVNHYAFVVGKARQTYGVKAPAISGHEMFERAYRVQMNTIESVIVFLPALWTYALYIDDKGAFATAVLWLIGRVLYARAYMNDPAKRGPGFMIAFVALIGAWAGGLYGVVMQLAK
jgi:glutathione S-transferase